MAIVIILDDLSCFIKYVYQNSPKVDYLELKDDNFIENEIWKKWKNNYSELSLELEYDKPTKGRWSDAVNNKYFINR